MVKRIVMVLVFMVAVGARHAVPLQGLEAAFAATQENGQSCPPECVTDTMEIMTWYPSPWNSYEELYTMKLGVGDVTTSAGEANLRPKTVGSIKVERSVVFKPMAEDPVPEKDLYTGEYTNVEQGEMIYNSGEDKFKYFNGQSWVPQAGSGGKAIIQTFCPWRYDYREGAVNGGFASNWGKAYDGSGNYPCNPPACPLGFDDLGIIGSEVLSLACTANSAAGGTGCLWDSPNLAAPYYAHPITSGRVVRACREQ